MDRKWWKVMKPVFAGEKISIISGLPGVTETAARPAGNSGAGAMTFSAHNSATRIILLGYDCKTGPDGIRHWHGSHAAGLGDAPSLPKFAGQFQQILPDLSGIDVINCSRDTALTLWPRMTLEQALESC